MKRLKSLQFFTAFAVLFGMLFPLSSYAATYYVSLSGDDGASGISEGEAWRHINYAAGQVAPGDTVYVKAGDYGAENVVMTIDGTAAEPIVFEGYKDVPGDSPVLNWSYPSSTALDPSVMPLLDGGDRSTGTGITLHSRNYVIVKNFQVTRYEKGVYAWASQHVTIDNVVVTYAGNTNEDYSGRGIAVGSAASHNTVSNCIVYNSAAEGISVVGDNNVIQGCSAYCDDNSTGVRSAMDYYIHVSGDNNVIQDCYAERVGDLVHGGHGIGFKGDCEYNQILRSTAVNFSGGFYVRHRGSKFNVIKDCTALNCSLGLLVRDGASENVFSNCRVIGAESSVVFLDTAEDEGAQFAGRDNTFYNCIFEDSKDSVINFHSYDRESDAYDNEFVNCTINKSKYLISSNRTNYNNRMLNSIVAGVRFYRDGSYPIGFEFTYSDFWDNGFFFFTPTGEGIIEANPGFVDRGAGDYHLTAGSSCIDAGSSNGAPSDDFDGVSRPQGSGYDLGVYEYFTVPDDDDDDDDNDDNDTADDDDDDNDNDDNDTSDDDDDDNDDNDTAVGGDDDDDDDSGCCGS